MRKIMITVLVLFMCVSGFMMVRRSLELRKEELEYTQIQEDMLEEVSRIAEEAVKYTEEQAVMQETGRSESQKSDMPAYEAPQTLMDEMAAYPDCIGWIDIEDTNVHYPIMQNKDNEYYLHRDKEGKDSVSGCIYMDSNHDIRMKGLHVIYGHYMKNGTMFKDITKFTDASFMEDHQKITIMTADREIKMRPVYCYAGKADGTYRQVLGSHGQVIQYLHDRFVDHNRERGREFDYKSQEGKQTRYNVKLFKKLQNQQRAMRREKEKLEKEREEIEKDKLNNEVEKQKNIKINEINKKNYAIVQNKENKNNNKEIELNEREVSLNTKEKELDAREKEIKIREQQQNLYRTYFDYREDYCNRMDVTGYAYEKALREYERTGDVKYNYYSNQDCKDYIGTIYPEVLNPDRSIEEKEAISKQCENVEKERNYYLIPEKLITHLETKEPEKEERSLDDLLDRADKKYDRDR